MKTSQDPRNQVPNLVAEPPSSSPQIQDHGSVDIEGSGSSENRSTSEVSPSPHHAPKSSRTLHVRYEGWPIDRVRVLDDDNSTILYTVQLQMRKPHITINSVATGAAMGTVIFHSLTTRIDTTVHSSPIILTAGGLLKNSYTYSSPALGGGKLTWKTRNFKLDLICMDEQNMPIARFVFNNWSLRKCGTFEMIGPGLDRVDVMEETLVTGLALVEYVLTLRLSTVVAANS